ncbi:1,4-alpha-glucan branching protein GlgB [Gellertiella hungarica]|uniref:1,4-alpha-glucan branching enzyme GlgB n=1 Tax=Gellertiella hungarica TaxID=1572859 RepID=A0A7W6J2S1_9HYPH|nr:1,4-alpha-glucan branching protein GlgB [Gellertiella hungarica]MBB4063047.1 1,4-alpha-glucan branching enzyme [Gellertiella hungarica]
MTNEPLKSEAVKTAEVPLATDIAAIVRGTHGNPFAVLGVHESPSGFEARCFIPGAERVEAQLLDGTAVGELDRVDDAGFFRGGVTLLHRRPIQYRAFRGGDSWQVPDPYSFGPILGPMDDYFLREGSHVRLHEKMGAHLRQHEGAEGCHFAVWAPNARRVSVVGHFNRWDGRLHVMRARRDSGIWEIFIPGVGPNEAYKFEIVGPNGTPLPLKADPFARKAELRPETASLTTPAIAQVWEDEAHMRHWASLDQRRQPISIYEVHAGSWQRRDDGTFLSWDELADRLIPYCVDMGFTHIEFLPITEHPYDPSWGYQTTGLYAPTARFGEPEGFARFVNGCHKAGLGVILDWVPAHFPTDAHGLGWFDGTALYEHADPRKGFHPDWNTAIYNFGRTEVRSYLINNALYWREVFHLDGLRVDAVASMLYLDYSRKEGEWVPNEHGGRENLEAVRFLQELNARVYGTHQGIMTIAEESTSWPKVSHPTNTGGLGFGFKWNMGFMHDTLSYLKRDPVHRRYHHNEMTFGLIYAFSENFVLPLSHDEVVHGKGSLIQKMAGDTWQKFATLRAYYAFMWGYPGKKLLFMGQEFAQWREWDENRSLDWHLLSEGPHAGMKQLVKDLNRTYRDTVALHARDCEGEGFEWLQADDSTNSVFAWVRRAPGDTPVVVITNFTPVPQQAYRLRMPAEGRWREIMNTDAGLYGGSGMGNQGHVEARKSATGDVSAQLVLPPLATLMLKLEA